MNWPTWASTALLPVSSLLSAMSPRPNPLRLPDVPFRSRMALSGPPVIASLAALSLPG
jgi:hypothetical protein